MQYENGLPTLVNRLTQLAEYQIPIFSRRIESGNFQAGFIKALAKIVLPSGKVTLETAEPILNGSRISDCVPEPFRKLYGENTRIIQPRRLTEEQSTVYLPLAHVLARTVDGTDNNWDSLLDLTDKIVSPHKC